MANFIEFPVFDGVSRDLRQWIAWLEDFFVRERFTGDEKMNLAQSLLEGEANAWFYSSRKHFSFQSWEHLVVELLLWRFGYFGDGGVFSDLELFLLWNKYDRILRKRRKRMTTTSIPEKNLNLTASHETTDSTLATKSIQEAISESVLDGDASIEKDESYEATLIQVEGDTTMFQISDSLEEESITQHQVPISSLEPRLRFSSESLDVSQAWQSEIVSYNRVHSQSGFECVKNMNDAHHVFDELSHRRHKGQQRKKLSLSPKSRMFKFKNKMLQRNRSQMDPHHVMDSNIVTYISSSSRAKFGFKWKEHNSRYWGRMRQTRLHMRHKWTSKHLRAVVGLQNNPSYALDVVIKPVLECNTTAAISQLVLERSVSQDCFLGSLWEKKSVSWLGLACVLAEWMMHTTTVISAKLYSLFSFEVDTEENISSGLSQTSQVWEPGGVLADHVLVDFTGYDGIIDGIRCLAIGVCSRINQPIDSRRASRVWERGGLDISAGLTDWLMKCYKGFEFSRLMQKLHKIDLQWARRKAWAELCVGHGLLVSWCGWMVFDRGKNKLILRDVTSEVIEALAKHCPQLTDLGFLDCLNHEMRGSNTSSHNLVHLMWHFKSQQLILLSLRILLHRFILVIQRTLIVQYRTCLDAEIQPLAKRSFYPRPLGCFHRTLYVFILHSSLRTSSFSGREVLIRFKAVMTWQSVEEQSEDLD